MFTYDNEYRESDWRHEADARELAELDRERRDMQETPPPVIQIRASIDEKCCDNPANFIHQPSYGFDPETGYSDPDYFRCMGCGSLVCEEDYAALVEFEERRTRLIAETVKTPKQGRAA